MSRIHITNSILRSYILKLHAVFVLEHQSFSNQSQIWILCSSSKTFGTSIRAISLFGLLPAKSRKWLLIQSVTVLWTRIWQAVYYFWSWRCTRNVKRSNYCYLVACYWETDVLHFPSHVTNEIKFPKWLVISIETFPIFSI